MVTEDEHLCVLTPLSARCVTVATTKPDDDFEKHQPAKTRAFVRRQRRFRALVCEELLVAVYHQLDGIWLHGLNWGHVLEIVLHDPDNPSPSCCQLMA
jgi:hypothetical protein